MTARPEGDANVAHLQARISELEAALDAKELELAAKKDDPGADVRYFNLSQEDLVEMARNCDVRSDSPGPLSDERAEDIGMSADEREAYARAFQRWSQAHRKAVADLYEEATGEPMVEESLAVVDVMRKLRTEADRELDRHIAEERAGLRTPPGPDAELGIYERYKRLNEGRGDAFERMLADELGTDRARSIRAANDGWVGGRQRHWKCPDAKD